MTETDRFELSNGLRVVYSRNPDISMAVVLTLYNVGSRDERRNHTGMAHLFEHLMFGGSANIPEFDTPLQAAGGISNAWTSQDFTCFYDILPSHNILTALWLESDRMLALGFSDKALEVQRSVVVEEFKQTHLNRPYGDMSHGLMALCFGDHPYGVPVIGRDFNDIEKTTQEDVKEWFYGHYAPNNAVLSIVANLPVEEMRAQVEHWYGDIPARAVTPRNYPDPPEQTAPRLKEMEGNVPQTAFTIAYPMPGYAHPDYPVADLITDILANGDASRFYQRLLLPGKHFTRIDASIYGTEHPGILMISGRLAADGPRAEQEAFEAIRREIEDITTREVSAEELTRVLNRFESDKVFENLSPLQKALANAMALMHGERPEDVVPRYRAVTPADILRVAREIFNPDHANTLIYRPKSAASAPVNTPY